MATVIVYLLYAVSAALFVAGFIFVARVQKSPDDALLAFVLAFAALWVGEAMVQLKRAADATEQAAATLANWKRRGTGRDG